MAGADTKSGSNRQLWQTISGSGFLRPLEFVEYELDKNKDKLIKGLSFYKKQRTPSGEALKERKLKKAHQDFVIRLGELLGLDELQSHDLFCAYLLTEYRGSQKELTHILGHERHAQTLLLKIVDFFYGERLYLLRCLRHIITCWLEGEHAYKDVFAKFLNQMLEKNVLGEQLLTQFFDLCDLPLPTKETHGPLMNRVQVMGWAQQNLKEQVELLELLVIYYKDFEMDIATVLNLSSRFKKHNFGWGQSYKHLVDGQMEKLVQRIGFLEILILLEGLDIMNAVTLKAESNLREHIILSDSHNVEKLDGTMSSLGSEVIHSPLLLGWSLLQYIHGEEKEAKDRGDAGGAAPSSRFYGKAHHYGDIALQLGVFDFFLQLLESDPFCGKSDLASISHYVVYSVVSALLSIFHEESLGNTETLYRIAGKLLTWDYIADTMWEKGEQEGLALLYNSVKTWFPLDFSGFVQLNISLAGASQYSAQQVKSNLHMLKTYTEALDNNRAQDLQHYGEQGVFVLRRKKHPFQSGDFTIEANCKGTVISPAAIRHNVGNVGHVIRWETTYNGWQYLMGEVHELLSQVSRGAGMVQTEQLIKVTMIMQLVKEVMTSDPAAVPEFMEILTLAYQIIMRFAVLSPAPVELLGHTVQCLAQAVPKFHSQVSHHLKQTGFLPFLTENIDDLSEVLSGDGVNQGLYGCVLTTTECAQGVYMVTMATLDLVTHLVKTSSKHHHEREHMASVLFILREVFPRFHKWRYVDISHRKNIGQKCLQLFHEIFNFINLQERQGSPEKKGPSLQESCVFSLLFTEAGRALLEIVATGVDNVQQALAQQPSLLEGAGVDLMVLIEMSLSLLNRLLLLKPPQLGRSPVEQALSSQPPGRQHQHLVATIAQYVYHRHSHRLPILATLLLKRLAMVSPMSILACLGNEAEPIRDMFLTRLQAVSEDIQLKVEILEMLSVCVDFQPGLIEIFLNVQQQVDGSSDASTKRDLKLGRSSCLPILLDLMEVGKQCTYECPPQLLCACLDLVHSLWYGMRETPMTVLREKTTFWPSVLAPLKVDLPEVLEDDDLSLQAMKLQSKLTSFSLRIVAMEIYAMSSVKLSDDFKKNLQATLSRERILYWSKAVCGHLEIVGQSSETFPTTGEQILAKHPALNMLLAWKNFMVTSSRFKVSELQVDDNNKSELISDLLKGVAAQFEGDLTQLKVKLASIASALTFTLVKVFGKEFTDTLMGQYAVSARSFSIPAMMVRKMTTIVIESSRTETMQPSVHIGLLGAITTILQRCGTRLDNLSTLINDLLPVVCSIFLQSSLQLPTILDSMDTDKDGMADPGTSKQADSFGVQLKLQIVCCSLLVELLHISPDLNSSLRVIQQQGLISCVLTTMEAFFKAQQGVSYVYSTLQLLTKIADTEVGANMLVNSNLTSHLCLVLTSCYTTEEAFQPRNLLAKAFGSVRSASVSWHTIYCLSLDLFSSLLRVLGYSFLDDALNVVGVHQDRLFQSLQLARGSLNKLALQEAEVTCNFILQLSPYHKQWRFHLPEVLAMLLGSLTSMVQTYMALLIRPRYLQHILDHNKSQEKPETILQTPTYLQHQTSLDDVDQPTRKLVEAQTSMLKLVGKALACLKCFTPPLPEILLDQCTDTTEWEPVLGLGFGTPSLDDDVEGITFGTLLNCVTVCVRQLGKADGKLSPHRTSPDDSARNQVPRPIIHVALELSLIILMSQACRYLRDPAMMPRDRQFLKRELGTELNSCLSPLHRQLRRGVGERSLSLTPPHHPLPSTSAAPSTSITTATTTTGASPQAGTTTTTAATTAGSGGRPNLTPQLSRSVSQTFSSTHDPAYFRLVQEFVQKVLK